MGKIIIVDEAYAARVFMRLVNDILDQVTEVLDLHKNGEELPDAAETTKISKEFVREAISRLKGELEL